MTDRKPMTTALLALLALLAATGAPVVHAADNGAPPQMERCDRTLGVLRIEEDTGSEWYRYYSGRLGSTAPVISAMVMESNCFVVVERGTGSRSMADETARARGDEARESDTRGKGQQVVADYLLKPEIVMNKKGDSGANLGGVSRFLPGPLGAVVGGARISSNEAATVMTLVDIRSSVRLVAAQGRSENKDFNFGGLGFGRYGLGGGNVWSNTDEGKMITAAFVDSYNKLVIAVKNYKAQTVEGGLGNGGGLGVQGGTTAASRKIKP